MIEYLSNIATRTIQHAKEIDNIVDLSIFLIAAGACCYAVSVLASVFICILSAIHEEIMDERRKEER